MTLTEQDGQPSYATNRVPQRSCDTLGLSSRREYPRDAIGTGGFAKEATKNLSWLLLNF
jgi:hypothetical protein